MSIEEKDKLESEAEQALKAAEELKKKQEKIMEEQRKKLENNVANRLVVSLGQSATTNPQMMNLLNKIDPKLTLQSIQKWDGKDMANHPLMQNKMVQHFAKTFAQEMLKVDQKMGGKLSQGNLGEGVQQGMAALQQFANSLPQGTPAQGAAAKFSKMLGNLSPTKAMVGSLAKTAASFAYQGAKMVDQMNQSQQVGTTQQASPTATNMNPSHPLKTANKMAGMLNKLSGGKVNPASAISNVASAASSVVSGGPNKLAKMLKDSFMSGVKGGKK